MQAERDKPAEQGGGEAEVLQNAKGLSGEGNSDWKDLWEKCAMIGAKMNKRKSRNGLRPRPDMPDIPGHADKGREERTHNNKYIDNGKRDIF